MANASLNEVASLINQQIAHQETLNEYLSKAEAFAHVAMSEDFLDFDSSIIHAYLWGLSDLVTQAHRLCNEILNILLTTSSLDESK